ncbi:hypothetical protein HK099_000087 [Clydaea vesicula]|uniref:Uncharacterized protein n=1 Tax=Clydaea vesicula TaxID=447962 RepID=A0AAD5XXJ3_9FUNG|nr:hypothetical protein HK099_000087 [Clydaea vesicula]KAJ3386981.1 hypothetical protein HDU92_002180 [Lobulomyces angularis]
MKYINDTVSSSYSRFKPYLPETICSISEKVGNDLVLLTEDPAKLVPDTVSDALAKGRNKVGETISYGTEKTQKNVEGGINFGKEKVKGGLNYSFNTAKPYLPKKVVSSIENVTNAPLDETIQKTKENSKNLLCSATNLISQKSYQVKETVKNISPSFISTRIDPVTDYITNRSLLQPLFSVFPPHDDTDHPSYAEVAKENLGPLPKGESNEDQKE